MADAVYAIIICFVAIFWIAGIVFWIATVAFGRFDGWIDKVLKRSPPGPPKIVDIEIPHRLGKVEPRRRLRVTDTNLAVGKILGGIAFVVKWDADRAYFSCSCITGYFEFGDECLRVHAAIPESSSDKTRAMTDWLRGQAEAVVVQSQ